MHNFMRYIRQNKKQIIKVAVIAASLFGLLQLLDYLAGQDIKTENSYNKSDIYKTSNGTIVSDKSAVSGGTISTTELKKVSNKIEEFVEFCNEQNTEAAYNLLSESCKEEFYPSNDSFVTYYYEPLFKKGKRTYSIQNWIKDTYIVKFTEDLLATGKSGSESTYQDYITIIDENGEKKLNINKYIAREELDNTINQDNIQITVTSRNKYMDYEEYEIKVTNNTEGTILLDQLLDTDSIYLVDNNKTKHIAYSNEIVKDDLKIYKGHTKTIKIKFDNPYISGRKIKTLCFSNVVLKYDINNKASFETQKISINL